MARGRFISTSIAEDDRLSRLSLTAELLYLKTIPHLDRDGMITGKAGALWGKVCPLREDLMPEMQKCIDEWIAVGLVIRMTTEKGPVLFFPGFLKNNTLLHYDRETPSQFPVPPGYERTPMGMVLEGTEQKRKPTRKPKEAQVPPSSNGNGAHVNDLVNDTVIDFASKGEEQEEVKVEVKVEVKAEAEGSARPAAAAIDPDVARLWRKWDANMPGTKTPVIVDSVNALLGDYSVAEIEEAIVIACKQNKRNLRYIEGILAKGAFSAPPGGNSAYISKGERQNAAVDEAFRILEDRGMPLH
jgi:hypothetical protein